MSVLKKILTALTTRKTPMHRACDISRADAVRIMNINAYC